MATVYIIRQWFSKVVSHSWTMVSSDSSLYIRNSWDVSVGLHGPPLWRDLLIIRQLSLGPEAALSLLIGQMVSDQVYGDPHTIPSHPELEAAAIAVITTFQVGSTSDDQPVES
jgi:hypothetical protein